MQTYTVIDELGNIVLENAPQKTIRERLGVKSACSTAVRNNLRMNGYYIVYGKCYPDNQISYLEAEFKNKYGVQTYDEWIDVTEKIQRHLG